MPSVLITGANRGIGLELARQYAAAGWRVLACCRDPKKAVALSGLGGAVETLKLDVADDRQIADLAKRLAGQAIDLLINNAGIGGGEQSLHDFDVESWQQVMRVNCIAPLRMTATLADNVASSGERKIIAITSRMGSIGDRPGGGDYAYRTSKAALNMAMVNAAAELAARGILIGLVHPGWVRTDMGGSDAPVSAEASVAGIRRVIEALDASRSGGFWDYQGRPLPW